jgi:hypothetical protein
VAAFGLRLAKLENSAAPLSDLALRMARLERAVSEFRSDLDHRTAQMEERLINTTLDRALAETRISPAERARWRDALQADFEKAALELALARPRLNLVSRVETLPLRPAAPSAFEEKQRRILALVNEKMRDAGRSYHQAWVETRTEQPTLF